METVPLATSQSFSPRLRARYVLLAIGLAILPLVLIALIMHQGLRDRLEQQQQVRTETSLRSAAQVVSARLQLAGAQLRTLSTIPPVEGILRAQDGLGSDPVSGLSEAAWVEQARLLFRRFGQQDVRIESIRLISRNERELAREDFVNAVPLPETSWQTEDHAEDPAFINSVRLPNGSLYISPVRPGKPRGSEDDGSVVSMATPVYVEGKVRAVMILDLRAGSLFGDAAVELEAGALVLADAKGRYALRPRSGIGDAGLRDSLLEEWPGLDPRKLDMVQHTQSGGQHVDVRIFDANPNGVASFWMVGAIHSEEPIDGLLGAMAKLILQWAIILGVIAVSVALVMADLFSKPLGALAETARKVRLGDLSVRAQIARDDEVGELATAFNGMLDSLQQSNQSLIDARVMAEEATKAKSAFLANMSHEVRTPMNGVIGMLELLAQTPLESRQSEYALTAKNSAEALLHVLNDILDFSKIEAGKLTIDRIAFDLRRMAEECVTLFSHRAQEKQIRLLSFIPTDVPPLLLGDPTRVRQVLMNLLGNAIKFTQAGEVSLTLRTRAEPGERYVIRFDVRDTGIGIDDTQRRRLFQPFAQADSSTTRTYGGTGLGLAISKRLVELMAGEIGVESRLGEGSLFWFDVPFKKAEAQQAILPAPRDLSGLRILVVDDQPTNRLIVSQHLESWGLHPHCVDSPGAALRELRHAQSESRPYDLAILDMQMPAMDGISLARTLRDELRVQQPRMLLLSSLPQLDQEAAAQAGIALSLSRPVSREAFLAGVAQVMGLPPVLTAETPGANGRAAVRVLLAEDNMVNQQVALYSLRRLGAEVTVVANGRLALEALNAGPYDLVLMDCQMPEMDGYDATRHIRAAGIRSGERPIPVIAMTANALSGDRERCLEAGMDDYLSKPFKQAELREIVERWTVISFAPSADSQPA